MEAKLILVGGKANKNEVLLKLPTIIGRSREAGLTIAHPMVSRKHCELFESEGMLRIRDLGSLNGTFIGERQIIEAPLRPNDEFTVGPLTFRVAYELPGDPAPPRAYGQWGEESGSAAGEAVAAPSSTEAPPVVAPGAPGPGLFPANVSVPDLSAWADASARQLQQPPVEPVKLEPVEFNPAQEAAEILETPDWAAERVIWEETPVEEETPRAPFGDAPRGAPASEETVEEDAEPAPAPAPQPAPDLPADRPKKKGWWPFRRSESKGCQDPSPQGTPAESGGEDPPSAATGQPSEAPPTPDPGLDEFLRKLQ